MPSFVGIYTIALPSFIVNGFCQVLCAKDMKGKKKKCILCHGQRVHFTEIFIYIFKS